MHRRTCASVMIACCAMAVRNVGAASSNKFRLILVQNYYHNKNSVEKRSNSFSNGCLGLQVKFARKAAVINRFGNGCFGTKEGVSRFFARRKALSCAWACSCWQGFALQRSAVGLRAASLCIAACRQL